MMEKWVQDHKEVEGTSLKVEPEFGGKESFASDPKNEAILKQGAPPKAF
jgi:hypothetical protein